MRTMLCFAKFGMLRISEYTTGPCGDCPHVRDIRFVPDIRSASMLIYYFYNSKTNQFRSRERVVCVCQCPGPCAVHEMIDMLSWRREVKGHQCLFRFQSGKLPSATEMNIWIKALCRKSGLNPRQFSSHGLRAGGVQDLLTMGVSDQVVQVLTRHRSMESLRPYKALSDEALGTVLSRFSESDVIMKTVIAPISSE